MDKKAEKVCALTAQWINEVYPLVLARNAKRADASDTKSSVAMFRANMKGALNTAHDCEVTHTVTKHGKPCAAVVGPLSVQILDRTDALGKKYAEIMDMPEDEAQKEYLDIIIGIMTAASLRKKGIHPFPA